jgi:hypothetical protein
MTRDNADVASWDLRPYGFPRVGRNGLGRGRADEPGVDDRARFGTRPTSSTLSAGKLSSSTGCGTAFVSHA